MALILIAGFFYFSSLPYDLLLRLTIYPVNSLINMFYPSLILGDTIIVNNIIITIIPACVGVSAYLLLIILNLSIVMTRKQRVYSILSSFLALLFLNILRIFILSMLLLNNSSYYDSLHKILWYFMSIVFVILVWFFVAYIFKIKNAPVYSDIKFIINTKNVK